MILKSRSESPLLVMPTNRFSVLNDSSSGVADDDVRPAMKGNVGKHDAKPSSLPLMKLSDILLHKQRNKTEHVRQQLWECLTNHGFVICTFPSDSRPGHIVRQWKQSLERDFFPLGGSSDNKDDTHSMQQDQRRLNVAELAASSDVYVSEKGVPMWKLGYELCQDNVREAFRIHAGRPDDQPWPKSAIGEDVRSLWIQGLSLCQNICDEALQLTLGGFQSPSAESPEVNTPIRKRPGTGRKRWLHPESIPRSGDIPERIGDYSVLYSMHYFNDNRETERIIDAEVYNDIIINEEPLEVNLKTHVDPSLFVVDFISADCAGLQVFDPSAKQWIDCDGPNSPINDLLQSRKGEEALVMFVGKAFAQHCCKGNKDVKPTLHRVVKADQSRRTFIYEQKYEEYFPPPTF